MTNPPNVISPGPRRHLKGLVFDVDGTLFDSHRQVPQRTREVCAKLKERGIWISIASARPPASVRAIAKRIDATGPFCALNGAVIVGRDGEIQRRLSMAPTLAEALIARFIADDRVSLNVYSGTKWIVPRMDARIDHEAESVEFEPIVSPRMEDLGLIEKVMLIGDDAVVRALAETMKNENADVVVTRSHPRYLEITAAGVDKAVGIATAAELGGLSLPEVVACGDGENDITMLAQAGYSIAMGHASQQLRDIAHQTVGSNDDGSLAAALEAYFLADPPDTTSR